MRLISTIGVMELAVLLVIAAAVSVPLIVIARKMGYPGAVGLLGVVPGVNIVLAWVVAMREWPIEREARRLRESRT